MVDINATISIITLNVHDVSEPVKRHYHRGSKKRPTYTLSIRKSTINIKTHIDLSKGDEKDILR